MSWDVILTKKPNAFSADSQGASLFSKRFDLNQVVSTLKIRFPGIQHEFDNWLTYEEDSLFEIAFNLTEEELMLHIHILDDPEDAVLPVISELCQLLNCLAIDTVTGTFLRF